MKSKLVWLLAPLLILAVVVGVLFQQVYQSQDVKAVTVMVPSGATSAQVSKLLQDKGVVHSAWLFRAVARLHHQARAIKAGEYHFSGSMNMLQVLDILTHGDVLLHKVTVPEGLRTYAVLALLAKQTHTPIQTWQDALRGLLKVNTVEGRLLPETYTYILPVQPKKILQSMIEAQEKVIHAIAPESTHDLRVIASVIEKETALDKERPLVSAVIHNRLRLGMPLQMDPTVIYGIWKRDGVFSGNIHRKDLLTDTPWNTYTRKGLPPTPICNPSRASLMAAAKPADVRYLYFVADGTGGHAFASTLAEHQANVKKWVKLERQKR